MVSWIGWLTFCTSGQLLNFCLQSTVIGLIAAIIVAGIYGAAAAKVKKTIDDIQKTIDNDNATLQADKAIVADMHLIDVSFLLLVPRKRTALREIV